MTVYDELPFMDAWVGTAKLQGYDTHTIGGDENGPSSFRQLKDEGPYRNRLALLTSRLLASTATTLTLISTPAAHVESTGVSRNAKCDTDRFNHIRKSEISSRLTLADVLESVPALPDGLSVKLLAADLVPKCVMDFFELLAEVSVRDSLRRELFRVKVREWL